jgi:hypothetical protein
VSGTRVSIVVMAADHGHDQRERQEPAEGRKQALSTPAGRQLRPTDYESLPSRLWRPAQCRPPRSSPV